MKSKKGASFERKIAVELSLWWTNGANEDVFWRTAGSGGRATVRGKSNKLTRYSSGDITFTHEDGVPFIDYFLIELKRGYSQVWDILTFIDSNKEQTIVQWVEKAKQEVKRDFRQTWMLIFQRDRKQICVLMEYATLKQLEVLHKKQFEATYMLLPTDTKTIICRFSDLFKWLNPQVFLDIFEQNSRKVPANFITFSKAAKEHSFTKETKKIIKHAINLGVIPYVLKKSTKYFNPSILAIWNNFAQSTNKDTLAAGLGVRLYAKGNEIIILHYGGGKVCLHFNDKPNIRVLGEYQNGVFCAASDLIKRENVILHRALIDKLHPIKIVTGSLEKYKKELDIIIAKTLWRVCPQNTTIGFAHYKLKLNDMKRTRNIGAK